MSNHSKKKQPLNVVLFNLGGPDQLKSVKPFLFNLFFDPRIIKLPLFFRWIVAKLISTLRRKKAEGIYQKIGSKSPLLENTNKQAKALENVLAENWDAHVHVSMRYWHPFSKDVIKNISKKPGKVVLLPLYPQFSTTTTLSSFEDWLRRGGHVSHFVCCYPTHPRFINAHVDLLKKALEKVSDLNQTIVLFVAHGLPEDIVKRGDPYPDHVFESVQGVLKKVPCAYKICYQSRVGPKKWLGPSIEEAILDAGRKNLNVVVHPISFVSDHSETLVELDMDMRDYAKNVGVPFYIRVAALQDHPEYIMALKELVEGAIFSSAQPVVCAKGKACCQRLFAKGDLLLKGNAA